MLREIVDPEAVALRAKHELGLIGPDIQDYTRTTTAAEAGLPNGTADSHPSHG